MHPHSCAAGARPLERWTPSLATRFGAFLMSVRAHLDAGRRSDSMGLLFFPFHKAEVPPMPFPTPPTFAGGPLPTPDAVAAAVAAACVKRTVVDDDDDDDDAPPSLTAGEAATKASSKRSKPPGPKLPKAKSKAKPTGKKATANGKAEATAKGKAKATAKATAKAKGKGGRKADKPGAQAAEDGNAAAEGGGMPPPPNRPKKRRRASTGGSAAAPPTDRPRTPPPSPPKTHVWSKQHDRECGTDLVADVRQRKRMAVALMARYGPDVAPLVAQVCNCGCALCSVAADPRHVCACQIDQVADLVEYYRTFLHRVNLADAWRPSSGLSRVCLGP